MKLVIFFVFTLGLNPAYVMTNPHAKPKVYVTRHDIPNHALELLKGFDVEIWKKQETIPKEVLLKKVVGKDALYIHSSNAIDAEVLDAAGTNLKVIATLSAGLDHINVPEAKRRGIKIGFTPDILTDAVADLAIGLMLVITRKFQEGNKAVLGGKWKPWTPWEWLNGFGVKNSTVGIMGLGRIGMEIGRRIAPFKPSKILYISRTNKSEANEIKAEKVSLDDLLKQSDIVFVSLSLNPSTERILNAEKIGLMKKTAYIINISRGAVIDQDALVKALKENKIAGAGLDVMTPEPLPKNHELLKLDNCYLLPHIGSAEHKVRVQMAEITSKNIIAGINDTPLIAEA